MQDVQAAPVRVFVSLPPSGPAGPNEVCFGHAVPSPLVRTGTAKESVDLQTGAAGPGRSN